MGRDSWVFVDCNQHGFTAFMWIVSDLCLTRGMPPEAGFAHCSWYMNISSFIGKQAGGGWGLVVGWGREGGGAWRTWCTEDQAAIVCQLLGAEE